MISVHCQETAVGDCYRLWTERHALCTLEQTFLELLRTICGVARVSVQCTQAILAAAVFARQPRGNMFDEV